MHIPDNYLSPQTCAVFGVLMVPVLAVSVQKVRKELPPDKLPLLGIGAAFSFLLMMFNVPVPGGTTAHAVGGTLVALLIGPYAACLSITIALLIQALFFGDGGILAFGANIFNMAFILPFVGYTLYQKLHKPLGKKVAMALGAYAGINAAALCAAIEFGVQPLLFHTAAGQPIYCPYSLSVSLPAMLIPHMTVAGFAEIFFTIAIFSFITLTSPGTVLAAAGQRLKPLYGLLLVLIALSPLGLLASATAWGEWGMEEISEVVTDGKALGFVPVGMDHGFNYQALFPDYSIPGLFDPLGYILSALIGVCLLLILFRILSGFWKRSHAAVK